MTSVHHLIINRSIAGKPNSTPSPAVNRSTAVEKTTSYSGMAPDVYRSMTTTGVNTVKESRQNEKKDMQDLNDRFATYIEKVRYLEDRNKNLVDDLAKLREKWCSETKLIKSQFQADLDEARRALDDAEKEKARLEIRAASLDDQIEELMLLLREASKESVDYKDRINLQNKLLADYQTEIIQLRKRIATLEDECEKDRRTIETLTEALARARQDLDDVTLGHIDAENRRQTLEEEIEFLKSVHEQEMKELQALAAGDSNAENRDFWKNEMMNAIREIQQMYEDKMDTMKTELESHYAFKVQEFKTGAVRNNMEATKTKDDCSTMRSNVQDMRERLNGLNSTNADLLRKLEQLRREKDDWERSLEDENGQLKSDIRQVRNELESILRQLQLIMDSKMGLELEIAAYRKLLEGEETRISNRSAMESLQFGGGGSDQNQRTSEDMSSLAKGEMQARTTYQRSAKGPMTISECPPDGKLVMVENTGRKEENIEGWKLQRTVDNKDMPEYVFDKRFAAVKPGEKIAVCAKGHKYAGAGSVVQIQGTMDSWGIGAGATTKLINIEGEERATHVMKTVYSS